MVGGKLLIIGKNKKKKKIDIKSKYKIKALST